MHCAPSTAHNIATSKMAAVLPTSAKRTNKGRFCRAKAFIRNCNSADQLTTSWFAIEKEENERNVRDPEVCSGLIFTSRRSSCGIIKLSWLRLWIMGAVKPVGQLSKCINEPLSGLGSLLYICFSNSESGETNISGTNKTHRSTRTTRGRPVFDVNTKFAAELTFCCV